MQITPTALPEVLEITPARFGDHRGFFSETWNRKALAEAGLDIDFCQDNHSLSSIFAKTTIRCQPNGTRYGACTIRPRRTPKTN